MSIIEIHDLKKNFGLKKVLRGVNFIANAGEIIALLGPNGAGKSTFLRILAGLLKPTSGKINILNWSLNKDAFEIKRQIGVVTHVPLVYDDLTIDENLRFFGNLYFLDNKLDRVLEILNITGLYAIRGERVGSLSRGMQQRVSIGRALLHDPQILLLDEPHTGLDQDASQRFDYLLRGLSANGRLIIMASHDISHVADLASRFDLLINGIIKSSFEKNNLDQPLLDIYREALSE